ncbi:MAG: DnaA/Hda family protein [Xanthobacteraceae bacterium]|nr:DnaA/Hda family protein [Xanthobacteraceae bacterium]
MIPPRQLAFALPHAESLSRDDFLDGPCNAAALALIERWPDWPSRAMMLVGAEGSGKSHLAAIWAKAAGARVTAAHSLTAAAVPAELATGALVIEDVDPMSVDERALFHLLNLAREHQAFLLMTARQPPATFEIGLRDLRSRLRALPVVSLAQPDDGLFRALIVKLGADRQMQLDEQVVGYLASRIERSFVAAREAVARLDAESLRLGRPVTRSLAADVLRNGSTPADE